MPATTIAAANLKITHDKTRNTQRLLGAVEEAASQGADILVLPEMGLQGYADFAFRIGQAECAEQKAYYLHEAETIPGPTTDRFVEAARRHGMLIQLGLAERGLHGNVIFNSVALIGPEGVLAVYRKIHNHFEYPYFAPGEDQPVVETRHGTLGSIICYDLCFPELLRSYALKGADMVLMSTAWPMQGHDRATDYQGWAMDLAAQSNAFFNHYWLVISNHCEKGAYSTGSDYYGGTQIVDPYGKVVSYLKDEEGLAVHTADLRAVVAKSRTAGFSGLNMIQDRRPEHYGLLAEQAYRHVPSGMQLRGRSAGTLAAADPDATRPSEPGPLRLVQGTER